MENNEEIEILDLDESVSDKIDEMLDFFEPPKKESDSLSNVILQSIKDEQTVHIDTLDDKLDEYKPSLKDFNIKNKRTKKYVKKAMLYVIIVMLLCFEFFINYSDNVLRELRIYATNNNLIKIKENNKYGFIDYTGSKIVNPKYSYAEDFINGYAIVKDSSNLPLIIDRGGKEIIPTGNYFSMYRADNNIIVSKATKKGLKYGVLDENLNKKIDFKYESINYFDGIYTFSKSNSVGIINQDGKEIFEYKLTDKQDKTIDVNISKVNDESKDKYAVVTINSSSQIVNITDGTVVTKPTLSRVEPEENNVFYEVTSSKNKNYFYVEDNKVILESDSYVSLKINSIENGVLTGITNGYFYEYISTKNIEQLKKGLNNNQVFNGENVFVYKDYDYKKNNETIVMVRKGEIFKTLKEDFTIHKEFENGIAIVKFSDGLYGYLNENGNLITDIHFTEVSSFDEFGEAIAKTTSGYGVINKEGKVIVDFKYDEIKMANDKIKKISFSNNNNVFYAVKKDNYYTLLNKKGKKYDKIKYQDIIFNEEYPILKVGTSAYDSIIIPENKVNINITSINTEYKAYENYLIIKGVYYNYKGKLIYTDN